MKSVFNILVFILVASTTQAEVVATKVVPGEKYKTGHEPKFTFLVTKKEATDIFNGLKAPVKGTSSLKKEVSLYRGQLKISCTRTPYLIKGYELWTSDTCIIDTVIDGAYDDASLLANNTAIIVKLDEWSAQISDYVNALHMNVTETQLIQTSDMKTNVRSADFKAGDFQISCQSADKYGQAPCVTIIGGKIQQRVNEKK
jgi:hypothetical protein